MEAVQRLGGGDDPGRQRVRLESYCRYMSRYFAFVGLVAVLVLIPGLGFASLTLYSLVLAPAGGVLRRPKLARRLMRGSGGILVGFGAALAAER